MEAIGLLEFRSIAKGIESADAMLKTAPVQLIQSCPVCSGKFVVIIGGNVSSVESSLSAGKEIGSELLIDELFIPNIHPDLFPAIMAATNVDPATMQAVGIVETLTIASSVMAADIAAKAAEVKLIEVRIARGLGGKAFFTVCGEVSSVRAAVDAGAKYVTDNGLLVQAIVIPSIHPDLGKGLL